MTSVFERNPFYHEHIKRFIIAFGETFNNITIRKTGKTGKVYQNVPVPVAYAPKNKWVVRANEQNDLMAPQVKVTLPRITFEIVGFRPSPDRRMGPPGTYVIGNIGGKRSKIFNPSPWDVTVNLYTYTKDSTDSIQLLEQILPYFNPYMTLNYEILPEYQIKKDINVSLDNYQAEDSFEGSSEEQREFIQTYTFTAPLDFFGPIPQSGKIIKDVFVNYAFLFDALPHQQYEAKVNPFEANKEDQYTIVEVLRTL